MTIAVDLGRKAAKQTNKQKMWAMIGQCMCLLSSNFLVQPLTSFEAQIFNFAMTKSVVNMFIEIMHACIAGE